MDIGYTTIGGTQNLASIQGGKIVAPEDGTIVSISFYCRWLGFGGNSIAVAVYSNFNGPTGDIPYNLLQAGSDSYGVASSVAGWVTVDCNYDFSEGDVLWICAQTDGFVTFYSDGGGDHESSTASITGFPSWPDPQGAIDNNNRFTSLYATYTTAPPVTPPRFALGWGIRKKLGKAGDPDPLNVKGIYQMRMTKQGKVPIKMKFYTPTNPQTVPQQANRQKFADAMTAWHALTSNEQAEYTERARKRQMFGRNLFIREYYSAN